MEAALPLAALQGQEHLAAAVQIAVPLGIPIVIGAVFTSVWVNDKLITNGKFILIVTRDTAKSHSGRLKLKYGPSNTYIENGISYSNGDFFELARKALGLSDSACWFVSEITVENQDTLKLKAIIVDPEKNVEYKDSDDLHKAWLKLEPSLLTEERDSLSQMGNTIIPTQTIFYGVPGSGKSYMITNLLEEKDIKPENTTRVVFHPEYTNSDFIGQILPKLKKSGEESVVDYQFSPGPFTRILREAYCNPDTNYALIIEEINRGNAAAIFGELFQLLDRLGDDETETYNGVTYTKGWSSYGIDNDCINAYICGLNDEEDAEPKKPCINFDSNSAIRIPPNLSIFATMNTSDQNVFPLDNAFKRRWDLHLIPNKFVFDSENTSENKKHFDQCFAEVEGFGFSWGAFVRAINKIIINEQSGNDISSFEDKQIGMWFVKASAKKDGNDKVIEKEIFLHKVIEYLFDDVFKLEPTHIFTESSLSDLIEKADNDPKTIFVESLLDSIKAEKEELEKKKGSAKIG